MSPLLCVSEKNDEDGKESLLKMMMMMMMKCGEVQLRRHAGTQVLSVVVATNHGLMRLQPSKQKVPAPDQQNINECR